MQSNQVNDWRHPRRLHLMPIVTLAVSLFLPGQIVAQEIDQHLAHAIPGEDESPYICGGPVVPPDVAFILPLILLDLIVGISAATLLVFRLRVPEVVDRANRGTLPPLPTPSSLRVLLEEKRLWGSDIGRLLQAGLKRMHFGLAEARKAAGLQYEINQARHTSLLQIVFLTGVVGFLLGLLAALLQFIWGLQQLRPPVSVFRWDRVADLIAHALVPLMIGLAVLTGAVVGYFLLEGRLRRVAAQTRAAADDLLTQASHGRHQDEPELAIPASEFRSEWQSG